MYTFFMTTFYLIRHGDKYQIPPDPELNDLGRMQAVKMATALGDLPIDAIVSSPLMRTRQTAQYLADKKNLSISFDSRLRERINWGDQRGQSRETFVREWIRSTKDREYVPSAGLSSRQAGENMLSVMSELLPSPHEHVALVSHGGIIADFLRNVFPADSLTDLLMKFPNGLDYDIHECSITEIIFSDNLDIRLERLNDWSHLQ